MTWVRVIAGQLMELLTHWGLVTHMQSVNWLIRMGEWVNSDVSQLPSVTSLSHPSLGWLYVFSSFPPRHPHPPQPQWLSLLTSKPFELDLRYLGQRKYRRKGGASVGYWVNYVILTFDLTHNLDLWFFKVKFQNSCIWGIIIWCETKRKQIS